MRERDSSSHPRIWLSDGKLDSLVTSNGKIGETCVLVRGKRVKSAVPRHEKDRSVGRANNEGGLVATRVISQRSNSLFGGGGSEGVCNLCLAIYRGTNAG